MPEHQKPEPSQNPAPPPPTSKSIPEIGNKTASDFSSQQKIRYPNPPDLTNPDPATLRDQWRYAIKQYSKWYSHAWGTAILAGVSFFALGWVIKGSNPLPSFKSDPGKNDNTNVNLQQHVDQEERPLKPAVMTTELGRCGVYSSCFCFTCAV
ncbi:hypothetical protein DITRI_Ditri19aG0043900 [Diplodiscus trichospermus]